MSKKKSKLGRLFDRYIEHSLRYYIYDRPLISDEVFDDICKTLLVNWDDFTHSHKHIADKSALEAGTGYQINLKNAPAVIRNDVLRYPFRTIGEVYHLGDDGDENVDLT